MFARKKLNPQPMPVVAPDALSHAAFDSGEAYICSEAVEIIRKL